LKKRMSDGWTQEQEMIHFYVWMEGFQMMAYFSLLNLGLIVF